MCPRVQSEKAYAKAENTCDCMKKIEALNEVINGIQWNDWMNGDDVTVVSYYCLQIRKVLERNLRRLNQ